MTEIFRTVHGSHLYGLAHEGSDRDLFIVTTEDRGKARQTVSGDDDIVRVGWRTFLNRAMSGSHQSAEALFSPYKIWTPQGLAYEPMFSSIYLASVTVGEKYERTIRKFCYGDFKKRRHAVRLSIALEWIRATGRFNPALRPHDIAYVNNLANEHRGDDLLDILNVPRSSTL